MGMTIDEAIVWLNTDDFESKGFADATSVAMDTMRKYQKIRLIINKWNAGIYDDEGLCDVEVLKKIDAIIDEVIEDGNDD